MSHPLQPPRWLGLLRHPWRWALLLLLHCLCGASAQAACTQSITSLTASASTVAVGQTVTVTIGMSYAGCQGGAVQFGDNNPPGLNYSSCSAQDSHWDCDGIYTDGSGATFSVFVPPTNTSRNTTVVFTYTATTAGSQTITITEYQTQTSMVVNVQVINVSPPTVTTQAASALTPNGATFNGRVSSNGASTTVSFEYGLTTSYGATVTAAQSPAAAGANNLSVTALVSGLTCNTLYNYRTKGVNAQGTRYGANQTFTTSACPGPDHYEIYLPTSSLNCLPSTVTIKACADSSSPCTNAASNVNGATATLSTSAGSLGATNVSFNASGVATTTLSHPNAANGASVTVTLSGESKAATQARKCCGNGGSCAVANSCSSTFNTSGFIMAGSAGGAATTLPTQTAGTQSNTYYLRAVRTNTSTQACEAALSGVSNVNWGLQCNNPTTCAAGNLMTVTGNANVAIAGNANGSTASSTAVAMTFDANGNAPFRFNYADVGQVTLFATKSVNSATLSGTSNAFVVAPGKFALSNIKQTASPFLVNPGAADATGNKFVKAGEAFTVTVTAQTSGGATTPSYGRETSAHGVVLTSSLVAPSGGATGALYRNGVAGSTIAGGSFSNGVATITDLSWSEVGVITLTPSIASADNKYLGTVAVSATSSGNIGRFYPAKFAVSAASVAHRSALSCSPAAGFTHLDENFTLGFTLTAQNALAPPSTTANYTGSFAKFVGTTASHWALAGVSGSQAFNTGNSRLGLGAATGNWSNGTLAVSLIAQAKRASSPDGPFNASFGIAPTDSDGVAMAAFDLASVPSGSNDRTQLSGVAVPLRFGRLRLFNGIGPAGRNLALPVAAQYWTGSTWDTNTLDNCTSIATSALNFGKLRGAVQSADASAAAAVTLSSGQGTLVLNAPGAQRTGGYELSISLTGSGSADQSCLQTWTPTTAASVGSNKQYLRGAWCTSTYDRDPSARATFGQYRGTDNLVYQRENY